MRRGVKNNKQHYSRNGARRRRIRPLLILGYEGRTELHYVTQLAKRYGFTIKSIGPGNHWPTMLNAITIATEKLSKQQKQRPIIPLILVDIEIMGDKKIAEARQFVTAAKKEGVEVFINRPTIEQWFAQHGGAVPETASISEINHHLVKLSAKLGLPVYEKPGTIPFHQAIVNYTDDAILNCSASGHSMTGLPCACKLIELLKNYSPL